ncbi:MAG TPA: FkbM family methyltransferase [Thermomonas sp.]|nr:FkbM family methyltransferase [Thermomonas sp.]
MFQQLKRRVPHFAVNAAYPVLMGGVARKAGLRLVGGAGHFDVVKGERTIRVSRKHTVYLQDVIRYFDYYFSAVKAVPEGSSRVVDYSTPRYHDVTGYDRYPVFFPSLAEPMQTTEQYLAFAALSEGMTVLDLGAYSGLTSIVFSELVGGSGTVVAVEPDAINQVAVEINLANYSRLTGRSVHFLRGAVWTDANGLDFSAEGNMGSSAESIVGGNRTKNLNRVDTLTLSGIVEKYSLGRVDFIKCDIEGAEAEIFKDAAFFAKFKPRLIVETHVMGGVDTEPACTEVLRGYGYRANVIEQYGVGLPLVEYTPS